MTPLDLIASAVTSFPDKIAFHIPKDDRSISDEVLEEWTPITYSRFAADVQNYARYWADSLLRNGIEGAVSLCYGKT